MSKTNALDFASILSTSLPLSPDEIAAPIQELPWNNSLVHSNGNGNGNGNSNGYTNGHQVLDLTPAITLSPVPAPPSSTHSPQLQRLLDLFSSWLYMPDLSPLLAVLGTVAAHPLPGNPVWIVLAGESASGKTELLNSLTRLDHIHELSTITPAALLSGTSAKEVTNEATGGVLRQLNGPPGRGGILSFKDLTSLFSMPHETVTSTLSALREISDGKWDRNVGSDGGRPLHWDGKASCIAGCTEIVLEKHQAIIAECGERLIYCRMPESDRYKQAERAWNNAPVVARMRNELAVGVVDFMNSLSPGTVNPLLDDDPRDQLLAMALFVSAARTAVWRDGPNHDLKLRNRADGPSRLIQAFKGLLHGMLIVGVGLPECWRVLGKIAHDTIPAVRTSVITYLAPRFGTPVTVKQVAEAVGYSPTYIRRVMEDLEIFNILVRERDKADYWQFSEDSWISYQTAFPHMT